MCEEDIIRYCAPTLAGMKTGSLFACRYPCKALLQKEVRSLNRRLAGKGLRVLPCGNPDRCIIRLMEQLRTAPEFPHEIGLFLGYPPEDVKGFIEQRALHCKCTGWWKVYGDQTEAEQTFARYQKCTDCYLRNWQRGKSLEALTVSLPGKCIS